MVPGGQGGLAVIDGLPALASTVGANIVGIRRIFYVFIGSVNRSVGALELTFADGRVFVLDSGPDGESLKISAGPWEDPFLAGMMSIENRDFIDRSGKWSAFDVAREAGYAEFVGATIEKVTPTSGPGANVTGVVFAVSESKLRVHVEADDLYVQLS